MKREAMGHTKMKRLCRRLDIALWQGVGLMESLWHLTAREAPRGDIGKLSDEDIALGIDYRGDETAMIEALVLSGWLDQNETSRLLVHDWDEHADDAVHMRLARAQEFFCSGCAPKIARLTGKDREKAHDFYTTYAQKDKLCAPPVPEPIPEPVPVPEPEPVESTLALTSAEVPAGVFELPLPGDQGEWQVPQKIFNEWVILYPNVSVMAELAKMRGWLLTNHRKTGKGLPRFINTWLAKEQDKSPRNTGGNTHARPSKIDQIRDANAQARAILNGMDSKADFRGGGAEPGSTPGRVIEGVHGAPVARNALADW